MSDNSAFVSIILIIAFTILVVMAMKTDIMNTAVEAGLVQCVDQRVLGNTVWKKTCD